VRKRKPRYEYRISPTDPQQVQRRDRRTTSIYHEWVDYAFHPTMEIAQAKVLEYERYEQ
jgi:hypothetical protein